MSSGATLVNAECLPLTAVPHTSRLLADYLYDPERVRGFFPQPPLPHTWPAAAFERPDYDATRRAAVAAVLERQNRGWGASAATLANLDRLRAGAAAVVTGQQVALFGGPVFSLYKALTAVRVAEEFTRRGHAAVPIFWLASEDHDFAEVASVRLPDERGLLHRIDVASPAPQEAPVGARQLGPPIESAVVRARELLGDGALLAECYSPEATWASAFARLFLQWFADFGLIVVDPSDPELHRIGAPMFQAAVSRSAELN